MNLSDSFLKRVRVVGVVALCLAPVYAVQCKTAPVAPYNATVAQIDTILADLKKEPVKYAAQIRTLEASKKEIVTLSAENVTASAWSGAAKGAAAVGGFLLIMSFLWFGGWLVKKIV